MANWLVIIKQLYPLTKHCNLPIHFHSEKKKKKKKKKAKDSDNEGEDAAEDLADLDDGGKSPGLSPSVHEECPPDNEVSHHYE